MIIVTNTFFRSVIAELKAMKQELKPESLGWMGITITPLQSLRQ